MKQLLTLPHRTAPGLCPVNGIRDLIHWRTGTDWSNGFVQGLGQGGGFAYLRFNFADRPRQVYWGTATPRQHKYLAELLRASYSEIENRTFRYAWNKACDSVERGLPPIIGPLDMYYLQFYEPLYHQRHIPIHYLLLVGYDDANAYVHDTGLEGIQTVPLVDLENAWNVSTPGLGKRNRFVILNIPEQIPQTTATIRQSILDECQTMLEPPVSMLGIPAMKKLAREIAHWPQELGITRTGACLKQVREYLSSPPDASGTHLTAGRDIYIAFLREAEQMAGYDFSGAINLFYTSIGQIPKIAAAIQKGDLDDAGASILNLADLEEEAFTVLKAECEPLIENRILLKE